MRRTAPAQPVDFSTLAPKYNAFVLDFIERSHTAPFFLYMPFSHGPGPPGRLSALSASLRRSAFHGVLVWVRRAFIGPFRRFPARAVHTTAGNQPQKQ